MQPTPLVFKKLLIAWLSCFLVFAPLSTYGAPLTPDGTTHTTLDAARNGVPIVNIASPSASGLSHNRFTHYNVNKNGLILNNAGTTAVKTQLGGYIFGNPHLTNNAKLILNEVTSTNRTQLNGFTEVAGPRTDLVIANQNGLTINGGGFINTGRLTLTTGRPVITGGALQSLNVTGGDIAIQGAGLNTQGQTGTSIYTQYLNLNAKVHAQNLDIKLGGNVINYRNRTAVANGVANARTVLLDASALGGMYANRITLVGTDKGLGVNLPPEVLASTGNISINNDGTISLQAMSASGTVAVNSGGSNVSVGKSIHAGVSANVTAAGNVAVNTGSIVAAGNAVNMNAVNVNNQGSIVGGLNANGTQKAGGAVNITANSVTNGGDIQSTGNMNVAVVNTLDNTGSRIAALGNATVRAGTLNNSNGTIQTGGNLTLNTPTATLTNSKLYAGKALSLTTTALNNGAASSISAGGNLTVQASNAAVNSGGMLAGAKLSLTTNGGLTNNKTISSGGALQLGAASLGNTGTISGGSGASSITVSGNINNSSRISAAGDLGVSGANVVNSGFFNAGNNLTVNSTNLTNNQTLFAGNNMNLYTTGTLRNNPNANIFAMNNLTMAVNAGLGNTANIVNDQANIETYRGNIDIHATSLTNRTNMPVLQGTYVVTVPGIPARPKVPRHFVRATWVRTPTGQFKRIRPHWVPAQPARPAVPPVPEHIVGGQRLSTVSKTTGCGFNCKNVTTTSVDAMRLTSSSAPATMNAGGNLNVNANSITNQYSLMSAGGNIHLAAKVVDNRPVDILSVTTVSTAKYRNQRYCKGFNFFGCWGGYGNRMAYVGTQVSTGKRVSNTVASTIQAGASITGNVANLTNGNIRQRQTIAASTAQTQNTSTTLVGAAAPAITLPVGSTGLFVVSPNPQGKYLIVTNPAFSSFGNFISSNYLLSRIGYTPNRTVKLLGDALYENRLIRNSIFAQTGRRFLRRDITSDYAQYQYLMDNAFAAREDLRLIPGVALTTAQIAALQSDIVWLETKEVAGHKVLVPVVYIGNAHDYRIEGGRIIAGDDINLLVDRLNNAGLMEAGKNLAINAGDGIVNHDGAIRAGGDLNLQAKNNIENISADMAARNITLVSSNGNIINRRYTEEQSFAGGNDKKTVTGTAGNITATEKLALNAGKTIAVTGSKLKGGNISLKAAQVDIGTTVKTSHFNAAAKGVSLKQQSTTHLGSTVEGGNVAINTTGSTTISGSWVRAKDKLDITASEVNVLAVNDSRYEENRTSSKGLFSHRSTTTKHATSTSVASNLTGNDVSLTTTGSDEEDNARADINITGSNLAAKDKLALKSAGDINVQAGFDDAMDETHTKKSGFFTGGALFSKREDLEGKLTKTAVLAKLSGKDVSLTAGKDMALQGVNITATESLDGTAQNITVENTNNTVTTYSKHEKLTVGFGDALKSVLQPYNAVKYEKGKASITLAKAEFSKADKTTTKTTVVSSNLKASNINLTARSGGESEGDVHRPDKHRDEGDDHHSDSQGKGDIKITGSNLVARNDVNLTAGHDVTIKEAKNTEKTASKDMKGTAELSLTVKNEYVQIGYAVKAAKQAKDQLVQSKKDYTRYKRDLGKQRAKLIKLKADLANGKVGIEQADVDEFVSLMDDLRADGAFYKANIALAAADLASKTVAVASQMAKAAESSGTYGFSAALELDIDLLEKKFQAYKEQSVGSNVNATNINITANNTATVRGSNLAATDNINIAAQDTNILASQDVSTSANSSERKNINLSIGIYGGAGDSISAGADRSKGSSSGITNTNSKLTAGNINIDTDDTTTITGANIHASDELNIKTKNLDVASVQDSRKSRSQSQGFSISGNLDGDISGVGVNAGNSRSREKTTVLTTLNGNNVTIETKEKTTLKGASIAAVDSQGNDTGNLTLKTGTLEVSSLNNRRDSNSTSLGVNAGISNQQQRDRSDNESTLSTVSIDFSNNKSNSKSKTLGTIGKGNIEVANVDESNTKMLNRDIENNEIDIYDIKSHKGLKGSLDTRLLTKKGRTQIAEDIMKAGMILNTVKLIATTDKVKATDFFKETGKANKTYEAVKAEVAKSPALAKALQNPDLSPQQKEAMLNGVTNAVMVKLGYKAYDNVIVATDAPGRDGKQVKGYASKDTGNAYINDRNNNSTTELVATAGHEAAHIMDNQDGITSKDGEVYANNYGENLANYTDMALDINGYGGMANTNSHTGNNSSSLVKANNKTFAKLDKSKGDNNPLILIPVVLEVIDKGITAYDAWQLKKAISEGRTKDAKALAAELGIGLATEAIPGNKILLKLGKLAKKGRKAVKILAKATKLPDLPSGYHYRTVGKQVQVVRNPGRKANLPQMRLVDGKLSIAAKTVKGLETRADKAVFWSGIGRGSAEKAAKWSTQHGGATLETVLASKGIKLPVWDASNPSSIAAWRKASTEFAAGARGDVRVLQGDVLRIDPIWSDEFKALQANPNVSSIRSINPETGAEVLLWSR